MANPQFKLTKAPIFEDNPELLLIPEFERLTERQMRYVFLVDWLGSPLRLMKIEDRKYKAAIMSDYKLEKDGSRPDMNMRNLIAGKVPTIEVARRIMKSIQYDAELDLKSALDTQIDEIIAFFKKPNKTTLELDKAVTLMTKLPTILETRKKILELLSFREIEPESLQETVTKAKEKTLLEEYNEQEK